MELLERGNPDEWTELQLSVQVGEALNRHYPNHPWVIGFQGRAIIIRHLAIADSVARKIGRQGFGALLPREKMGTPKEVARQAVMFGGQLLEAFGLPRGAWDGRDPVCPDWGAKQQRGIEFT